jgi:hypothetical protein
MDDHILLIMRANAPENKTRSNIVEWVSLNSLQLAVEKRFSLGFTFSANYTYGRSIDWVSYLTDLDGINIINPYNVRAYRGVSDYNTPHRLVFNYVWQLPAPAQGWARAVFGGWQTSAIWNWQSGFPLNIVSGNDTSFSLPGLANDQANVVSKPHYTSGSRGDRIAQWFTTASFAVPRDNTFGNAGRNILGRSGDVQLRPLSA